MRASKPINDTRNHQNERNHSNPNYTNRFSPRKFFERLHLQNPPEKIYTLPQLLLSQVWNKDPRIRQYSTFKLYHLERKMQKLQRKNLPTISSGGVYHPHFACFNLLAFWIELGFCGKKHFDSLSYSHLLY